MNRQELEKKLGSVTSVLLRDKGYICMIDVFVGLGYLADSDVAAWRMRRVPYLEKAISTNLSKASFVVRTVRKHCINGQLKERHTAYKSWGKGQQTDLRFSKSGHVSVEKAYATHFIR